MRGDSESASKNTSKLISKCTKYSNIRIFENSLASDLVFVWGVVGFTLHQTTLNPTKNLFARAHLLILGQNKGPCYSYAWLSKDGHRPSRMKKLEGLKEIFNHACVPCPLDSSQEVCEYGIGVWFAPAHFSQLRGSIMQAQIALQCKVRRFSARYLMDLEDTFLLSKFIWQ